MTDPNPVSSVSPDVAIVVPTYNRADMVGDAIESVLGQTFSGRIELVVVDDGSVDHTRQAVASYVERYQDPCQRVTIRYVHQANQKLSIARNTGIAHTTAPFIAFLDDDDVYEPSMLERQLNEMRGPEVGFVHTSFRYVDQNGRFRDDGPQRLDNPCVGRCLDVLLDELLVVVSTVMVRRSTLLEAAAAEPHGQPFEPVWERSEDYDLALRMARICKFAYVPQPLLRYRLHENNIASSPTNQKRAFGYHCRAQLHFARRWGAEIGVDESDARRRAANFLFGRTESMFWQRNLKMTRQLCDLARELDLYDDRFAAVETRASRPAWIYSLKDRFDRVIGRA